MHQRTQTQKESAKNLKMCRNYLSEVKINIYQVIHKNLENFHRVIAVTF